MQHAVDDGLDQVLRVLGADHDVAELTRAGDRVLVDGKRQDVRRRVLAAMVAVQLADALLVDQLDREVTVADTGSRECGLGSTAEARIVCLDLGQLEARRRSSGAWRAACSS